MRQASSFSPFLASALALLVAGGASLSLSACRKGEGTEAGASGARAGAAPTGLDVTGGSCPALTGTPWQPSGNVPEVSAGTSRRDKEVRRFVRVPIRGAAQGWQNFQEIEVEFGIPEDLGPEGSLTLTAEVSDVAPGFGSEVTPILTSFSDGVDEFITLPRSGAAGDCERAGLYVVGANDRLSRNSNCRIQAGGAYPDDQSWWRAQDLVNDRAVSVNTFPTCRFGEGRPGCPFTSERVGLGGRLRFGSEVVYRAKYLLLARRYAEVPEGQHFASLKVSIQRKVKTSGTERGVLNLDWVLVGSENIQASRTPRGARNLETLLARVRSHFEQANSAIRIGRIRVVEWGCAQGGDAFARLPSREVGTFFREGSLLVSQTLEGNAPAHDAVRVFLVSGIESETDGRTFLGLSGAVGGPPVEGTGASGVVFGTFGGLASFNPDCAASGTTCPGSSLEPSFVDLAATLTHEVSHFLGLAHLSEASAILRDPLSDTPACTMLERRGGTDLITSRSCSQDSQPFFLTGRSCQEACPGYDGVTVFCPAAIECEYNHVMWWTAKGYHPPSESGDGNFFSVDSGSQLRLSPLVF